MEECLAARNLDVKPASEKAGFRVVCQSKHIVMSNEQHVLTIPRYNPVHAITIGVCS
jgi:hypothetical protein